VYNIYPSTSCNISGLLNATPIHICQNLKRIYVHEDRYEAFKAALVKHVDSYNLRNGAKAGITHVPLQNTMQYNRVRPFL
jgi:acyl-CoA reductase-like NAD-dependent aldehyde dehydrogenase